MTEDDLKFYCEPDTNVCVDDFLTEEEKKMRDETIKKLPKVDYDDEEYLRMLGENF